MILTSINGRLNQSISPHDRGLLFGESIYEVIPIYNQKPFCLDMHLSRLSSSFKTLFAINLDQQQIIQWITSFLQNMNTAAFSAIYIQVTTGSQQKHRNHLHNNACIPNIIISEYRCEPIDIERYKQGYSAILLPDIRSGLAKHKSTQLSINTNALNQAQQAGMNEAIFVKNNLLTEGASSNLFIVSDNTLITPPLGNIVPGVTRHLVLKLAKQLGMNYQIRPIHTKELLNCTEVFLSSSIKILKPINFIPNNFSYKKPGKIWNKLLQHYIGLTHAHSHQAQT
ncbi:aminotransferase class IV [Candidatus Comchoanobacter bicostacola]|uniref:branched-chain-amino-acid transaminase n=1 Tax=Candidatus Comchoanobacter bicostacola TaxID=2919598 RepID=A0ABY5DKK5_9GAMM|nr:aminotransferase class IV [Candidatus Comchoanobacter bicostacola]UTC24809.1 aminotransferase class IV [Candidatus Comchoanobacter bicostacola]